MPARRARDVRRKPLADAAYAVFALRQPLDLEAIAEGASRHSLPEAMSQAPEWFAAAASTATSLLHTAPELRESSAGSPDLVQMYGEGAPVGPSPTPRRRTTDRVERTAAELRMLKELAHLED